MNDLDKAKLITGSDAKTGQMIGLSKENISKVRHGYRALTPYQSARLAELIGERWHDAALARLAELAASEEERRFWQGKSATLAKIAQAGALVVFLIIGGVFPPAHGSGGVSTHLGKKIATDYLLRTFRRPTNGRREKAVFRGADVFRAICESLLAFVDRGRHDRSGLPSFGPQAIEIAA